LRGDFVILPLKIIGVCEKLKPAEVLRTGVGDLLKIE
jgi:hypothetical protein